jgi:DNA-binding XRE family transcriptional regulator
MVNSVPKWAYNKKEKDFYDASVVDQDINKKNGTFKSVDGYVIRTYTRTNVTDTEHKFGSEYDIGVNGRFKFQKHYAKKLYKNFVSDMRDIDSSFKKHKKMDQNIDKESKPVEKYISKNKPKVSDDFMPQLIGINTSLALRELRQNTMTQEELANKLGINLSTVVAMEKGDKTVVLTPELKRNLFTVYKTRITYLD